MTKNYLVLTALTLGFAAMAHAQGATPTKVAIIHIQNAILNTKDGQKAQQDMQARFNPKKSELEKKQADLASMQDKLKAPGTDAVKAKLTADIETLNKSISREGEDFEAEVQQEENKIMNDLGTKMMDVVTKYATQNNFAMVVDVSNPQSPVLWRDPAIDITGEMVKLYDQAHPAGGAPAQRSAAPAGAAPAAAKPPASAPAKPPATPPAQKKQ